MLNPLEFFWLVMMRASVSLTREALHLPHPSSLDEEKDDEDELSVGKKAA